MEEVKDVIQIEMTAEAKEIKNESVEAEEKKLEIQNELVQQAILQVTESAPVQPAGTSAGTSIRRQNKLKKRKAKARALADTDKLASVFMSIMTKLNSQVLAEFPITRWGLGTQLEKIKSTVSKIQAALPDARKNEDVSIWLKKLKDVAYNADELLDQLTVEAQRVKKHSNKKGLVSFFLHLTLIRFRLQMARKLKKMGERLDAIARERDYFELSATAQVKGSTEESSSDWTQSSSAPEESDFYDKDEQKEQPLAGILEKEVLEDAGESSPTTETTEWTLLITNLLLEGISAIFDQLDYALLGMVAAFIALILCIIDIIHVVRKGRTKWDGRSLLPCFYRQSTHNLPARKPFCTIAEYFGFFGAVWQCFYSTMQYTYARQNKDNPIKMCLLPFIFIVCVIIAKLVR